MNKIGKYFKKLVYKFNLMKKINYAYQKIIKKNDKNNKKTIIKKKLFQILLINKIFWKI